MTVSLRSYPLFLPPIRDPEKGYYLQNSQSAYKEMMSPFSQATYMATFIAMVIHKLILTTKGMYQRPTSKPHPAITRIGLVTFKWQLDCYPNTRVALSPV